MSILGKGINFNVNLSDEQIEQIASITADKVNYTKNQRNSLEEYYELEITRLKDRIKKRNEIIVNKEILLDRYRERYEKWKNIAEKYRDKYGELE